MALTFHTFKTVGRWLWRLGANMEEPRLRIWTPFFHYPLPSVAPILFSLWLRAWTLEINIKLD